MAAFPAFFVLCFAAIVTGQVQVTPENAVRRVGDDLAVLCKVAYPIDSCRMTVGGQSYIMRPADQTGDVTYSGQGFQYGECGAHIRNIKESWNGNITCLLPPQTGSIELKGVMRLLVAKAPEEPILTTPEQNSFREGDNFNAECIVRNGRPAARISWLLDDEVLLVGFHQPLVTTEGDLETISQKFTRTLSADDANRHLICKVEHEALDQPKEAKIQLVVHYPPKREESGPIKIFGLKLGEEGRLDVRVRASPPPRAVWTVGGARLEPGQPGGAATALEPRPLGDGYYNVTLVLKTLSKEDVDRKYYLEVTNDLGIENFIVTISTMEEPAGVQLDTGAIVGIVVAVLVLLIAVFLVVFAKATDRWCFSGGIRERDHTKSSGESSDTESAVGGRERSRLAGLGARMRAVLPRAKDKVQATEAHAADPEDKPLSEDKKSVVYAELALSEQPSAEKPPPPSTEYAEIVYTDQPQQKQVKE